jgi:hypothetical protein
MLMSGEVWHWGSVYRWLLICLANVVKLSFMVIAWRFCSVSDGLQELTKANKIPLLTFYCYFICYFIYFNYSHEL